MPNGLLALMNRKNENKIDWKKHQSLVLNINKENKL